MAAKKEELNLRMTTLKMPSRVGGGLRMLAALNGQSVSDAADDAVREILVSHGLPAHPPVDKAVGKDNKPIGRPGPSVQQAAASVLRLSPKRKDAIPTRIEPHNALALANLATKISSTLGELASEGAVLLLQRSETEFVRDVAGLTTPAAYESAIRRVQKLATEKRTSNATGLRHTSADPAESSDGPVFIRLVPNETRGRKAAAKAT